MATDKLQINEGTSGKYVGTYTITEDAATKHLSRAVLNDSAGVEQNAIGIKTAAAVTTDADGTVQQYLRGLAKQVLAFITFGYGFGADSATYALKTVAVEPKTLKRVAKNVAASGDNTIVAAVGGKCIKVYTYALNGTGTVNAKFTDGASGTQLSILWRLLANTAITPASVNPPSFLYKTTAGNALILNLSGAVGVEVEVSYWDDDGT